ncbi:hypothetical protein EDF38_0146 [Frigoribacterium sp. PhB160]|nr:hypothetical protein EDF38_0146 [Frigoribacterium sp. PhB160]
MADRPDVFDSALSDFGRAVLPHRDPTFDAVARLLERGDPVTDWCITGPRTVIPSAVPEVSNQPVTMNLQPAVAHAVLQYLLHIAEPQASRSGKSITYRLKGRNL